MTIRTARSAPAIPPSAPSVGSFETLHQTLKVLWADPGVQQTVAGAGGVNRAIRDLLEQHPELELLPLELLADELMPVAGARTPWHTCM